MKVFIVFLGLLLVNLGFVCYSSDMTNCQLLQKEMKAVAEECAAGAALFYEEQEYSEGRLVIKDADAVAYVEHLIGQARERMKRSCRAAVAECRLDYTLHIIDERDPESFRSYRNGSGVILPDSALPESVRRVEGNGHTVYEPSIVVDLTMDAGDLFRLPFLELYRLKRSAMYELSGNRSMR